MARLIRSDPAMEDLWRDAIARFNERTKKNVNMKPPKTLHDCIREIEGARDSVESDGNTRGERFKEYGINILRCLKLLGGVAAQAADVVFGAPSSVCFNALYLLLDVPEQLRSFHQAVDGLFETLGPILSSLRIYERIDQFNDIEPELKQVIHEVMISFVDICALSIELRDSGKWRKFKSRMKLLIIQDDAGIEAEIGKIKKLTEAHHSIQSTQTLKVLLETKTDLTEYLDRESERSQQMASDVASLKAADEKRNSEEVRRKNVENIKKKLGIEESLYSSFMDMCDKPRKESVPNTALWFIDNPEFRKWAERDNKESSAWFTLTGAPNTGKSVIMSAMLHYLRSMYESSTRSSPRTLVAAFFFPSTTTKDDLDKQPVATALKCISIQLAEQDSAYAKNLSQACDEKSEDTSFFRDASCQELWNFLRIGSPKGSITYYLIFDGLGNLADESPGMKEQKEQLLNIICKAAQSTVRILLSARRDMLRIEDLPPRHDVEIEQYSESDIRGYIESYLRSNDLFQDPDDKRLKTRVLGTLSKQVQGNFNKVKAALENIRDVVASDGLEAEIDKILNESNMNEEQITKAVISQLEERLTGEEIDELNELLIWVICGTTLFTIDQLNAALVLRFKRRGTLRLRKKLEGKYSNILTILKDGRVDIVDRMDETISKRRIKPRTVDDKPTFTATITITKGDLRSVQSFLWSLSQKVDDIAHDTFGFQQISGQAGLKNSIQVNEVDGCLTIVRRTFTLLAAEPNKESWLLGHYLLESLPQHLEELLEKATGYDELTPAQKQEIGEGLFALLVSGEIVERHWSICQTLIWYREAEEIEIFRKWLDDPIATSHLGRLDREWLKEVRADSNPNQAILAKIMRTVAWHWLCDRKWSALKSYEWLRGFRQMRPPQGIMHEPFMVPVEEVAEWCKGVLSITEGKDRILMNERLGETYYGKGQFESAIEVYNHAVSLGNPSWTCLAGLAKALAGDTQYEQACQEMLKVLDLLSSEDNPEKNTLLGANYRSLATWQTRLRHPEPAIEYAKHAIHLLPNETEPKFELLLIYLDNDFTDEALSILDNAVGAGDPIDGSSIFGRILREMRRGIKSELMFEKCLYLLSKHLGAVTRMLQEIDYVIDRARRYQRQYELAELLLHKGIIIYRHGPKETTRIQRALHCWEQCLSLNVNSWVWDQNHSQDYAASWICSLYFNEGRRSIGGSPQSLEINLKKLEDFARGGHGTLGMDSLSYIASYYATVCKDAQKAQEVLQGHFDAAFEMLSDDNDDNDGDAYYDLAEALVYYGDESNALCAFSLPLPLVAPSPNSALMRWILDFETEPELGLSERLISMVNAGGPRGFLHNQVELALELIRGGRFNIHVDDNIGLNERTIRDSERLTDKTSGPVTDESTNDHASEAQIQSALERIQLKLEQWTSSCKRSAERWCDVCAKSWDFDTALNHCRFCYNTDFCDGCLAKLKVGELRMFSLDAECSKDHDWIRLPRRDKETYMRSLRQEVYIGGYFDGEGRRVGGEVVSAATWLEGLREKLGTKKADTQVSETGQNVQ
ncbi:hypothetical protein F5Y04DRAFT_247759 [Hypomontagnella monticulosa]|nr:hypothetical protein F5Y04DRAFT_247759 [Hypomontagnella monticulosa]